MKDPVSCSRGAVRRFFEAAFRIRPEEFALVQAFFAYFVTIGMFYSFEATVGETLFLSRLGASESQRLLPWIFIGVAAATVGVTLVYDRLEKAFSRIKLLAGSQALLALSVLAFRWAVAGGGKAVYFALMVWLEACVLFAISMFFSFAGDYFTSRDARRLYAYITGGLSVGIVVAGYAVEPVVRLIGTENMLFLCAAFLLAGAAIASYIHRSAKPLDRGGEEDDEAEAPLRSVLSSPYLLLTFAVVLIFAAVTVLVDYNMLVAASRRMQEEQMAAFFGNFYAYTGLASLLVQFLLVGWLFSRLGAIKSLILLPALMLVSNIAFFLHPTLMMAAGVNFIFVALAETLDMPATELLFLPLPSRVRLRVQTLVDGALAPIGHGLGGAALIALSGFAVDIPQVGLMVAAGAVIWIAFIVLLLPQYRRTLATSLKEHLFSPSDLEGLLGRPDSSAVFNALLASEDPQVRLSTLDMLRGRPLGKFEAAVSKLAASAHEPVAVAALELLGADSRREHLDAVRRALADPRAGVRSAAVLAFCRIAGDDAVREAAPYLDAAEPDLVRSALLGLARYGGFDGALLAYPRLERLLKSADAADRVEAVKALADIGLRGTTRVLERLLSDPEEAVRQEALLAARRLKDPGLAPKLIELLADIRKRPLAMQALDAMPREAVGRIVPAALDSTAPASVRAAAARALGNIGGGQAGQCLWRLMDGDEDVVLRLSAAQSLRRLKAKEALPELDMRDWDLRHQDICEDLSLLHRARGECRSGDPVSAGLLADHAKLHTELLFSLLSLRHDPHQLQRIESRFFGENEALRANAVELLEVILPRAAAEKTIPPLSGADAPAPSDGQGLSPGTAGRLVRGDRWACAIALFHISKGKELPEAFGGRPMTTEDRDLHKVITTISFLKQVDIFRDVPANYLASLAEMAEEKTVYGGETLFKQGDTGDSLFLIQEGQVRIVIGGAEAARLGPRDCIGEMALLDGEPRSATAVVTQDARLLRIDADDFYNLLAAQPAISTALLRTLARRLRQARSSTPLEAAKQ